MILYIQVKGCKHFQTTSCLSKDRTEEEYLIDNLNEEKGKELMLCWQKLINDINIVAILNSIFFSVFP